MNEWSQDSLESAHEQHGWERMSQKPKYGCVYVKCICPKCRDAIVLKIYTRQPIPGVAIAEPYEEEE